MLLKRDMPERKPLSWKPQLRGETYCSPACGGGCKKAAYDEAQRRSAELAKRMGEGWKPRVWENLDWYYEVISPCGRITVSPLDGSGERSHAFLGGGLWFAHGDTPEEAVRTVIAKGKLAVAQLQALVEGL